MKRIESYMIQYKPYMMTLEKANSVFSSEGKEEEERRHMDVFKRSLATNIVYTINKHHLNS